MGRLSPAEHGPDARRRAHTVIEPLPTTGLDVQHSPDRTTPAPWADPLDGLAPRPPGRPPHCPEGSLLHVGTGRKSVTVSAQWACHGRRRGAGSGLGTSSRSELGGGIVTDGADPDRERWGRGLDVYRRVYGERAVTFERGEAEFFDLMLEQLFAGIWDRPGLAIPTRRLLVIGVLAAQHQFDTLELQLHRALEAEELTVEQVREVAIHLIPYIGYPSSAALHRVTEAAIAAHQGDGR